MKRIGAGIAVVVIALTLVSAPATAQNGSAWFTPKPPDPQESAGEVVLTVQMWRAGRVFYRTLDGTCAVNFLSAGPPPADCADHEKARAPEDYAATTGELLFTEGGRKTITIPIVDDGLAEGREAFTVVAWEEANADPFLKRGDTVVVRIVDDEVDPSGGNAAGAAGSSTGASSAPRAAGSPTNTSPTSGVSSGSAAGASAPTSTTAPRAGVAAVRATTTTATVTSPSPGLQVALPDGDLRPGPGFEHTTEEAPEPAAVRAGGSGGSASGLGIGSGIALLGVGALAVVRRRRQWSAMQS